MVFNYNKLKGKITEKYGTQHLFAQAMDWSDRTLSLKLNNSVPWNQKDIFKALALLDIDDSKIGSYFFNHQVQSIELTERNND